MGNETLGWVQIDSVVAWNSHSIYISCQPFGARTRCLNYKGFIMKTPGKIRSGLVNIYLSFRL